MTNTERIQANNEELREAIEMAETLPEAGGGGVSVQSDWNQTDETAADFIKNRPFGDVPTVILEEQELAFDAEMYGCIGVLSAPIQYGDFLSIVADGEGYECEVVDINGNIAFGNLALAEAGEDTGEPFLGMYFDGMVMFMFMDELNHIVGIAKMTVTKIPNRYYNTQTIFYLLNNDSYLYTDRGCTTKVTLEDLINALSIGSIAAHLYGVDALSVAVLIVGVASVNGYGIAYYMDMQGAMKRLYTAEYTG